MMKQKDLAIKIKMSETKQPLQKKINEQDHKKIIEEIRASTEIIKAEATGSWLQKKLASNINAGGRGLVMPDIVNHSSTKLTTKQLKY